MGLSMFQVKKGINLDGLAQVMSAAGVPGAAGDASTAPVGSLYLDVTNGQMYVKKTSGVGTDKWKRTQNSDDMADALNGISWREPVLVRDNTLRANLAAAVTAANVADTVDGQTISAGVRLLLDNVTGSAKNVYLVSGSTGAWVFTEDANALTKGDTLYVNAGTDAGKTFNYNATTWVQQGSASSTEISYLQSYTGKTADGNEMPTYTTENVVATGDSLETAVGKLDYQFGVIEVGSNFLSSDDPVGWNLGALDTQLGQARTYTYVAALAATQKVVDSVPATSGERNPALEWTVVVRLQSDQSRMWAGKVFAIQDGTNVDYNVSSVLGLGTDIPGLNVTVDISGGNIQLLVFATNACWVSVTRASVGNINS